MTETTAVATFKQPRLPWAPPIEERFGVDRASWKALVEAVYPNAKSVDSVVMALSYCKARRLDPFKRPVHIVPVWSTAEGKMVDTVWPGISEQRTTAMRTNLYAGCDEVVFGEDIYEEFTWTTKGRGDSEGKEHCAEVCYPEWARMTVYRLVAGLRVAVVGPKVYWKETYATVDRWSAAPNEMWRKRPRGQLEKCAEAAALRRAFPEELGDDPTAEEMEGQVLHGRAAPEVAAEPGPAIGAGFGEAKTGDAETEKPLHAAEGEAYVLVGWEPGAEDKKVPVYKDGVEFQRVSKKVAERMPAFAKHAPQIAVVEEDRPHEGRHAPQEAQELPLDKPAPPAESRKTTSESATNASSDTQAATPGPSDTSPQPGDGSSEEDEQRQGETTSPSQPSSGDSPETTEADDAGAGFIFAPAVAKVDAATAWPEIYEAMKVARDNEPVWSRASEDDKRELRKAAWVRLHVLREGGYEPPIYSDYPLFRLWAEFEVTSAEQMTEGFGLFWRDGYAKLSDNRKVEAAQFMADRISELTKKAA